MFKWILQSSFNPLLYFFPNSVSLGSLPEQVGAAKIRIAKVPRFPGRGSQRFPSQVPKQGSQGRWPKVSKQGSQEHVSKRGSQARFPRFPKVPRKRFPSQVPKQDSQENVSKQGFQELVAKQSSQEQLSKKVFVSRQIVNQRFISFFFKQLSNIIPTNIC